MYNAQMILMPAKIVKHVNTLLFSFLWNCKKDKIKRKALCMNYELGGLKMVDLDIFVTKLSFKMDFILLFSCKFKMETSNRRFL